MNAIPRLRVLLVDDEPEQVRALSRAFRELGFAVETAIDAGDAMSSILSNVPDLVCVTLNLPSESGYELCDLIRGDQSLDRVRILVLSDRHLPEDIAFAEEAGANAFLRTPFSVDRLGSYVKALFDDRSPSRPGLRRLRPSDRPPPS